VVVSGSGGDLPGATRTASSQCQTPQSDGGGGRARLRCGGPQDRNNRVLADPTLILEAWDVNRQGVGQRRIGLSKK